MVDFVSSPDVQVEWGLEAEFKSMVKRLLQLDHQAWVERLTRDGFTKNQILDLDVVAHEWASRLEWDELTRKLANCDWGNEGEIKGIVAKWLQPIPKEPMPEKITSREVFPDTLDALCYAVSRLGRMVDSTVEFERTCRELDTVPKPKASSTPEQKAKKKAWAEAGLAEDTQSWPRY